MCAQHELPVATLPARAARRPAAARRSRSGSTGAARSYPVAFTNLDVLASVVEQKRSARRWVPLVLLLLALDVRGRRARAPADAPDACPRRTRPSCSSSTSRARCAPNDVEPTRLDAAHLGDAHVPRPAAEALQGRARRVQLRAGGARAADARPRRRSATRSATSQPEAGTAIGDGLEVGGEAGQALARARRRAAQAGRARAGGDRAALGRRAEPRPRSSRSRRPSTRAQAKIKVYTVSLGTPDGVVSFGFGLFVNSIPVPPDPADDAARSRARPAASRTRRRPRRSSPASTGRSARASAAAPSCARSPRGSSPPRPCCCSPRSRPRASGKAASRERAGEPRGSPGSASLRVVRQAASSSAGCASAPSPSPARRGGSGRARRRCRSRRRSAPARNAAEKPSTAACACAVPDAIASDVRDVAIVESAAMPSAPPICCDVLIRPDARPASCSPDARERGDRDRHEREAEADADEQEARQQVGRRTSRPPRPA